MEDVHRGPLPKIAQKIAEYAGDPLNLARYLVRLLRDDRVPQTAKLTLLGSGLCSWIDTDLMPDDIDALPGLGYVDDMILLVHGVKCLMAETDPFVAAELWPADQASFKRVQFAVTWLDDKLYERARTWLKAGLDKIAGKPGKVKT